ncbi:MAG: dTDP-glucose 4,6-dehydratase [Vicinamibacterales bacterium]|jgi:dTDP-glucose 4,6-dehydratase|nr:dTDP-glucose 4,6-dehydratase [Vicinamibacterales bacterium]
MVDGDTMVEVLVTGGAGFIGSNFVLHALTTHPDWRITTLDKLTYAGRMENLRDVMNDPRHRFVQGDVTDAAVAGPLVRDAEIIVHFAAETHVDRSLHEAGAFITTDVYGSFVLLDAARQAPRLRRFVQISTDEVYGSVDTGSSTETDEVKPRNPYAASKAGADRLAYSYWATYDVPVIITRASNNYGPRQFPEKIVPLFVTNAIDRLPLPLYGDGLHVRDWLHVDDHCRALDLLIDCGANGEVYNIGGGNEVPNIDLTHQILALLDRPRSLIEPVSDRLGHDRRYSLDTTKLRALGWQPQHPFLDGLRATVDWYRDNAWWWRPIKEADPAYRTYHQTQYGERDRDQRSQQSAVRSRKAEDA